MCLSQRRSPFCPIHITTAGTSWTKIIGCPALGISSVTSKTYANKAIQVRIELRMREYGYTTTVRIALDVAGQIRSIQEACQEVVANSGLLVAQSTLRNEFCPVWVDDQSKCAEDISRFEDVN